MAAEQQPLRGSDPNANGAGQQAQHETGTDDEHVKDDDVLEPEGVGNVQAQIDKKHPGGRSGERRSDDAARQQAGDAQANGHRNRKRARRQWPEFLFWVLAVLFTVGQIVEHIDGRGEQAEGDEGPDGLAQLALIHPGMAKQQAGEDEKVLHPLMRAQQGNGRVHP